VGTIVYFTWLIIFSNFILQLFFCNSLEYSYHGVWLGCANGMIYQLLATEQIWLQYSSLVPQLSNGNDYPSQSTFSPTAATIVHNTIWIGDETSHIYAYSLV
jgi:hypothetical protein